MLFVIAGQDETFTDVKDDEQILEKWKNSVNNNTELTVSYFYKNENENHDLNNGFLHKDIDNLVNIFLNLCNSSGDRELVFNGGGSLYSLSFNPSTREYIKINYN